MAYFISETKTKRLLVALLQGRSIREAARIGGVANETARSYRKMLEALGHDLRCECGLPAEHRGWCANRYRNSPKRQAVMARLHAKQRSHWTAETFEYLAEKRAAKVRSDDRFIPPPSFARKWDHAVKQREKILERKRKREEETKTWHAARRQLGLVRRYLNDLLRDPSSCQSKESPLHRTSPTSWARS